MPNAGFFGLFDFTGLFVGTGIHKPHGSFHGAGRRHLVQQMLMEAAESERRNWKRSRNNRIKAQQRIEAKAKSMDIENFVTRRRNSISAYSIMLAEI